MTLPALKLDSFPFRIIEGGKEPARPEIPKQPSLPEFTPWSKFRIIEGGKSINCPAEASTTTVSQESGSIHGHIRVIEKSHKQRDSAKAHTTQKSQKSDSLNNVIGLIDQDGNTVMTCVYDAWGSMEAFDNSGNVITPFDDIPDQLIAHASMFGYRNQLHDLATGEIYMRHRQVIPELGIFTTPDPLGEQGGTYGLYSYVSGDPVNYWDPMGLSEQQNTAQRIRSRNAQVLPDLMDDFVWLHGAVKNSWFGKGLRFATVGKDKPVRTKGSNLDVLDQQAVINEVDRRFREAPIFNYDTLGYLHDGLNVTVLAATGGLIFYEMGGVTYATTISADLYMKGGAATITGQQIVGRNLEKISKIPTDVRNYFLQRPEVFRLPANTNYRDIKDWLIRNLGMSKEAAAQFARQNYDKGNGYIHYGSNRAELLQNTLWNFGKTAQNELSIIANSDLPLKAMDWIKGGVSHPALINSGSPVSRWDLYFWLSKGREHGAFDFGILNPLIFLPDLALEPYYITEEKLDEALQ